MARETSKQKPGGKNTFDDELGDDFLSSWKPSKSLAALDFEDDEPVPKNRKASFSLAKMDTSFDFDFDGGLNALSKFHVDMSDLDLPTSRDKSFRTKDSSQEKQPCDDNKKRESKFSFQFHGFDELDLDDTLKTKKEPETPLYAKKGKADFSSKHREKGLLDSLSDNGSESTLVPTADASVNKESRRSWNESALDRGKPLGELAFSDEDNSAHELGHPFSGMKEQASRNSDDCIHQRRRDSDLKAPTTFSAQVTKVVSPVPPQVTISGGYNSSVAFPCSKKESNVEVSTALSAEVTKAVSTSPVLLCKEPVEDGSIETERAARLELDVESSKKSSGGMEVDVSSSESERQELHVDEKSLVEESNTRMEVNEFPPSNENLMLGILEEPGKVETDEQQRSSMCNLKPRQEVSSDGNCLTEEEKVPTKNFLEEKSPTIHLDDSFAMPIRLSGTKLKSQEAEMDGIGRLSACEPSTVPTEASPIGRPAKRKFSGKGTTSDSSSSKQNSRKKLEVEDMSESAEFQEVSDSATSLKKHKNLQTSSVEKHQDMSSNPLLRRTASKLAAYKSLQDATSLKKTTVRPSLQSARSLLGSPEYRSSHQRQTSLVSGKPSITHLQSTAAPQKKPTLLGGCQSPSMPSTLQPNRNLCQLNSVKDRFFQGRSRPVTEKQLEGMILRKTSGLAVLSKTRVMGASREKCEKSFKFDIATSPTPVLPISCSTKVLGSPKIVGDRDEQILQNPDSKMADMQSKENWKMVQTNAAESLGADMQNVRLLKETSDKETVQAKGEGSHLAISVEIDAGISDKSEYYTDRLDQLLKELKNKYEEAMDLRVRAMVINNSFMMLNNPVDDEKIRKITHYVREKLSLDVQGPSVTQPS